ncbi:MAG: hypothetical protein K2F76_09480, partial [Duncaniella dubosii]|nr:hypothetical protein [Duncaniella dubosii]
TVAIRSANRSASLPFNTGVSLIGLAIFEDFNSLITKIQHFFFDIKGLNTDIYENFNERK